MAVLSKGSERPFTNTFIVRREVRGPTYLLCFVENFTRHFRPCSSRLTHSNIIYILCLYQCPLFHNGVESHRNLTCFSFTSSWSDHKYYPFSLEFWLDNMDKTSSLPQTFLKTVCKVKVVLTQFHDTNKMHNRVRLYSQSCLQHNVPEKKLEQWNA
jgi:hypothetical protein